MPHTFLRQFLLKAYQNLYVEPQPSNKEFIQGRWQQQLLTFNTKGFKCHSFCSVKYSVLTGNNQQTLFKKKQQSILLISSLSLTLLIVLLNNLPISIDGPLSCICTHVSRKVETYILLNPKLKFYTRWKPHISKRHAQLHSAFLFCPIMITQLLTIKFKKWATIRLTPVSFIH